MKTLTLIVAFLMLMAIPAAAQNEPIAFGATCAIDNYASWTAVTDAYTDCQVADGPVFVGESGASITAACTNYQFPSAETIGVWFCAYLRLTGRSLGFSFSGDGNWTAGYVLSDSNVSLNRAILSETTWRQDCYLQNYVSQTDPSALNGC